MRGVLARISAMSTRSSARGIEAVRQFTWGGSVDYIENGAGQLETRILSSRFQTSFENSDRLSADIQQDYEFLPRPFAITDEGNHPHWRLRVHGLPSVLSYGTAPSRGGGRLVPARRILRRRHHRGRLFAGPHRGLAAVSQWSPASLVESDHAAARELHGPTTCRVRTCACAGSISRGASCSSCTTITGTPG